MRSDFIEHLRRQALNISEAFLALFEPVGRGEAGNEFSRMVYDDYEESLKPFRVTLKHSVSGLDVYEASGRVGAMVARGVREILPTCGAGGPPTPEEIQDLIRYLAALDKLMQMTSDDEQDEVLETVRREPDSGPGVGDGTVRFAGAVSRKPVSPLPDKLDETLGYRPSPGRALEAGSEAAGAPDPAPADEPVEVTLGFGIEGLNLTLPLALGRVREATGSLLTKSLAEMEIGQLLERRRTCLELVRAAYEGLQLAAEEDDHDIRANAAAVEAAAARQLAPSNPAFADLMTRFLRDASGRTASSIRGDQALSDAVPAALEELAAIVRTNVGL